MAVRKPGAQAPGKELWPVKKKNAAGKPPAGSAAALPNRVQAREEVKQKSAEGDEEGKYRQPLEDQRALLLAGRRRGDANHKMQSTKQLCQEADHDIR
jgi:hypothetical protein